MLSVAIITILTCLLATAIHAGAMWYHFHDTEIPAWVLATVSIVWILSTLTLAKASVS